MAAEYTKVFADPYPNGWKAKPDLSTPYTTSIRDNHDATLRSIESHLNNNPIPTSIGDLSDVDLTGLQNRYVLIYNNLTQKFEPGEMSGGGGGGGISYSTTEHVLGTDENGDTLYGITLINESNDYTSRAKDVLSKDADASLIDNIPGMVNWGSGKLIRKWSGTIKIYVGSFQIEEVTLSDQTNYNSSHAMNAYLRVWESYNMEIVDGDIVATGSDLRYFLHGNLRNGYPVKYILDLEYTKIATT